MKGSQFHEEKSQRDTNTMKLHLLGSAAGKTVPRPFCRCRVCEHALRNGGPDLRTRTGMNVFLDGDSSSEPRYRIDLPPDTGHHIMRYRFNMHRLEHLLFTHSHEDHFDLTYLGHRGRLISDRAEMLPLHLYGSRETADAMAEWRLNFTDLRLEFHEIEPLVAFQAGELQVFPLPANHTPGTVHFILQHGGRSVLLAWDTAWYPRETWDALRSFRIDAVFMECTQFGGEEIIRYNGHLNFYSLRMMRERLLDLGVVKPETPFISAHTGDNGQLLHEERVALATPHRITVGYDGMEVMV